VLTCTVDYSSFCRFFPRVCMSCGLSFSAFGCLSISFLFASRCARLPPLSFLPLASTSPSRLSRVSPEASVFHLAARSVFELFRSTLPASPNDVRVIFLPARHRGAVFAQPFRFFFLFAFSKASVKLMIFTFFDPSVCAVRLSVQCVRSDVSVLKARSESVKRACFFL
jgi:hypothetical protein